MNISNTFAAVAIGILISTSAFAEGKVLPIRHHEKERHTSRDDLINWCTALPLQYSNTTVAQHTASSDQLRDHFMENGMGDKPATALGLQWSIRITVLFNAWSAVHYFLATKTLNADIAASELRASQPPAA